MSTENQTKINHLLQTQPSGVVLLSSWLKEKGYSLDLQKRYRRNNWLQSIGSGANIRTADKVDYMGGLYALQSQKGMHVHIGARSAIALLGKAHYLDLSKHKVILFGERGEQLPRWFSRHNWGIQIEYHQTSFLPPEEGLTKYQNNNFSILISNAARAIMECLYLVPEKQELSECYEIMESLNNLRPDKVQNLLEKCSSVKVKRLFLYLAEKVNPAWFGFLDLKSIKLGTGKRSIGKNGIYIPKYQIVVPKEMVNYGKQIL